MPVPYLTRIDVVEAGLKVLESLRFMNNRIKIIDENMIK